MALIVAYVIHYLIFTVCKVVLYRAVDISRGEISAGEVKVVS